MSAVWDEDAARGRAWVEELGVPFEAELDRLLARQDVDAIRVAAYECRTLGHRSQFP